MAVQVYQQFQIIHQPDPNDPSKTRPTVQLGPHALFSGGVVMEIAIGIDIITAASLQQGKEALPSPVVVKGLLDTGCTVTSIDSDLAKKLNLKTRGYNTVNTANGSLTVVQHQVSLAFPGTKLASLGVLTVQTVNLTGQPYGVLIGRDLMARWSINYNGPAGFVSIAD